MKILFMMRLKLFTLRTPVHQGSGDRIGKRYMSPRFYIIPAAIILFILFFTVFGERGVLRIYRMTQEKEDIQKKAAQIMAENEQLKREIDALKSDRRYLESIARKEFGLVRPNEIIYQFPSKPASEQKIPIIPPRSSSHHVSAAPKQ